MARPKKKPSEVKSIKTSIRLTPAQKEIVLANFESVQEMLDLLIKDAETKKRLYFMAVPTKH